MKTSTNSIARLMATDVGKITGLSIAAHWSILISFLQILSLVAAEWIVESAIGLEGLESLIFFAAYFALAIPNLMFVGYVAWTDIVKKRLSLPVYIMVILAVLSWGVVVHIANN